MKREKLRRILHLLQIAPYNLIIYKNCDQFIIKTHKERRCWVRDVFKNRHKYGAFESLFKECRLDWEYFFVISG